MVSSLLILTIYTLPFFNCFNFRGEHGTFLLIISAHTGQTFAIIFSLPLGLVSSVQSLLPACQTITLLLKNVERYPGG